MSIAESMAAAEAEPEPQSDPLVLARGRSTSRQIDGEVVTRLQKVFDFAVVVCAGLASLVPLLPAGEPFALLRFVLLMVLGGFCFTLIVRELGGYGPRGMLRPWRAARRVAAAGLGAGLVVFVVGLAIGAHAAAPGAAWAALWWGIVVLGVAGERGAIATTVRHWDVAGRLSRRVVIVGAGTEAQLVAERLGRDTSGAVELCGVFDDRSEERTRPVILGAPHLGTVDDLVEFSRWFRVDAIIVALPLAAERRLLELLKRLWVVPADIRISALGSTLRLSRHTYSHLGGVPMLDAFDRPMSGWGRFVKYVADRVLAAVLLVLLAPLLLATAIAVKLDSPGPVLFRQPRYGFNSELIEIFKFRSLDHSRADLHAERQVSRDDLRLTRVGRFIRRTSIDELPQLINVLRGELSLVGPRPHALKARAAERLYDEVVEGYLARHRVRPGLTGWAQIHGWRGETDTEAKLEARVEHDLYYIEHWSLLLDLTILLKTPLALWGGKGAY